MVFNEELDWESRCLIAIGAVQTILKEKDVAARWSRFSKECEAILGAYSGGDVEDHEGAVRIPDDVYWKGSHGKVRILTAPDPELEGGILLLCLVFALDDSKEDVYITSHESSNYVTDVALDMIPEVEAFARSLPASPRVRGGMVVLDSASSNWKTLFWDGRRWINLVYLEFQ